MAYPVIVRSRWIFAWSVPVVGRGSRPENRRGRRRPRVNYSPAPTYPQGLIGSFVRPSRRFRWLKTVSSRPWVYPVLRVRRTRTRSVRSRGYVYYSWLELRRRGYLLACALDIRPSRRGSAVPSRTFVVLSGLVGRFVARLFFDRLERARGGRGIFSAIQQSLVQRNIVRLADDRNRFGNLRLVRFTKHLGRSGELLRQRFNNEITIIISFKTLDSSPPRYRLFGQHFRVV